MSTLVFSPGHRTDVEHGPATALLHLGCAQLGQAKQREDVDPVGPLEVGHRHLERLRSSASGIVDQNVDAAESGECAFDEDLEIGLDGDVAGDGGGAAPRRRNGIGDLCGAVDAQVTYHDGGAGAGKQLCNGTPDARTRSRHDGDAVVEAKVVDVEMHRGPNVTAQITR
jgi:hypothetical protein